MDKEITNFPLSDFPERIIELYSESHLLNFVRENPLEATRILQYLNGHFSIKEKMEDLIAWHKKQVK